MGYVAAIERYEGHLRRAAVAGRGRERDDDEEDELREVDRKPALAGPAGSPQCQGSQKGVECPVEDRQPQASYNHPGLLAPDPHQAIQDAVDTLEDYPGNFR